MYWTNGLKVTLKDAETAAAALEIMKARLIDGFDCDKNYRFNAAMELHDTLEVFDNSIVLPEDSGSYLPGDSETVFAELMEYLAKHLSTENFTFTAGSTSDYDEGYINGNYTNGELKFEEVYFSNGFSHIWCPECEEIIASMDDNAEGDIWIVSANGELIASKEDLKKGKTFICPECGEEIDLSDWVTVSNKTIKII